jgi:nucleoid DNA-binding protein
MINIDDVIKEVAKNLNLDKETVNAVCKHVFQETVNLMKSEDTSDILFNELFKFKLKRRYKEDKQRQYGK